MVTPKSPEYEITNQKVVFKWLIKKIFYKFYLKFAALSAVSLIICQAASLPVSYLSSCPISFFFFFL